MFDNFKIIQNGKNMKILKNNQDFIKVTNINTQNMGYVLSLVRRMIELKCIQKTISFIDLKAMFGTGIQ